MLIDDTDNLETLNMIIYVFEILNTGKCAWNIGDEL